MQRAANKEQDFANSYICRCIKMLRCMHSFDFLQIPKMCWMMFRIIGLRITVKYRRRHWKIMPKVV